MTSKKFEFQCKPVGNMTPAQFLRYIDEFLRFKKEVDAYAKALATSLEILNVALKEEERHT